MHLKDRQHRCPPGTFVYVPRDTPHTFGVVSDAPGQATPEALASIAARNNMDVLGPVPDTYL